MMTTASPTPTPIPAAAPADKPEEEVVGDGDVVAALEECDPLVDAGVEDEDEPFAESVEPVVGREETVIVDPVVGEGLAVMP
jgi:hypothetical protein